MKIGKCMILIMIIVAIIVIAYLVYKNLPERPISELQEKRIRGLAERINDDQEQIEKFFRKGDWDKMLELLEQFSTKKEKFRIKELDSDIYHEKPDKIVGYLKTLRKDDNTRLILETDKIKLTVLISPRKDIDPKTIDAEAYHIFKYSIITEKNDTGEGDQEMKHIHECDW